MATSPKPYPDFHIISKPFGPICNLDCHYCFYLEKENLYPSTSKWTMPPEVLERFIEQYIAAQHSETVSFTWQGGEPTLAGLDFFERILAWQTQYARGKKIENSLQTNAVLIDDRWAEFLKRHQFLVGVSLDGPRDLHDHYRLYKGGRSSFDDTLRGLKCLQKHGVEFNTLTVVNRKNSYEPLRVYEFLKQVGSRYMQFLPVVERRAVQLPADQLSLVHAHFAGAAEVTEWSVEPLQYGNFLCEIFNHWVRHDVAQYFVQIFDVSLGSWLGVEPALCVFRETCGGALAIEHNGDLYSCDHFVYPEHRLGNLLQSSLDALVQSPQQVQFGNAKRDTLPKYCQNCEVRFACHGECPKHRFTLTPDGEPGLNYLCPGYKRFFNHIHPYMTYMAREIRAQRSPASIMPLARANQLGGSH